MRQTKTSFTNDVVINGNNYRQVVKHFIYYPSNISLTREFSIINRGANVSVAGKYTHIFNTHSDRTIDVRGTDNHKITSEPQVAAGGVANVTSKK